MNPAERGRLRLAILSTLVKKAPQKPGRTALMKFAYLLQTVRQVPLGYRFELYNYGPYDSTVLSDLSQAATAKAVKSAIVHYPSGYGYAYSTNETGHAKLCGKVSSELAKCEGDIEWVLSEFGTDGASRLELVSTIVFAEREMRRKNQKTLEAELCTRVSRIKPHFTTGIISRAIEELESKGMISLASK
jgi:uncharacterized protein YwgA